MILLTIIFYFFLIMIFIAFLSAIWVKDKYVIPLLRIGFTCLALAGIVALIGLMLYGNAKLPIFY